VDEIGISLVKFHRDLFIILLWLSKPVDKMECRGGKVCIRDFKGFKEGTMVLGILGVYTGF
jgi:hypothetical protein